MRFSPRPKAVCALLIVLLAGCASLGPAPDFSKVDASDTAAIPLWKNFADKPPSYLAAGVAPTAEDYLAPPPAPDSPRGQADLAIYRATRALAGTPRWSLAQRDADNETPAGIPKAFSCPLGVELDINREPILLRMLMRASDDSDDAARTAKEHYARKRPFLVEDGPICIAREDWLVQQGSYPSGHAAAGWMWALILSELAPDRAEALMVRGRAFGDSRVVCGVHYPSDIEAGREVAVATLSRLRTDPAFEADLRTARAELARARQSGPKPASCDPQSGLDKPVY